MRHHFIPQFYLRPWLSTDNKLEEYGRIFNGQIRSRRCPTKATGFAVDLYTVPGVTEETKNNIEKMFMASVDTHSAKVRDMLLRMEIPAKARQRHTWATFILSLVMRHPEAIQNFRARFLADFDKPIAKLQADYDKIRKEGDPLTVEEAIKLADPTAAERQALIIATQLMESRKTSKFIRDMAWGVVECSGMTRKFMTSDRPVIMTNGLGFEQGHIVLPISPTHVFIACTFENLLNKIKAWPASKLVRQVNAAVIGQARDKVYGLDGIAIADVRRMMSKRKSVSLLAGPDPK